MVERVMLRVRRRPCAIPSRVASRRRRTTRTRCFTPAAYRRPLPDSLPKLGVPGSDTLKRFLYSAEPVVSAEALAEATLAAGLARARAPRCRRARRGRRGEVQQLHHRAVVRHVPARPAAVAQPQPGSRSGEPSAERATQVAARRGSSRLRQHLRIARGGRVDRRLPHQPKRSKTPGGPGDAAAAATRILLRRGGDRRVPARHEPVRQPLPVDAAAARRPRRLVVAAGTRHIAVQRGGRVWKVRVLDADGGTSRSRGSTPRCRPSSTPPTPPPPARPPPTASACSPRVAMSGRRCERRSGSASASLSRSTARSSW